MPHAIADITINLASQTTVLWLREMNYGSLQEANIDLLKDLVTCAAEETRARYVILDLSRVRRIGARLLGMLVGVACSLREKEQWLVLCGDRWEVTRVTNVDRVLPAHASRREACRWCTQHAHQRSQPLGSMPAERISAAVTLPSMRPEAPILCPASI